jgi:ferredoxin
MTEEIKESEIKEKEKDLKEIAKEAEGIKCIVQRGIFFLNEFLDGPMCGKCLPCPMSSYEMRVRFKRLSEGAGAQADIDAMKRLAPNMLESSMCKKGKDTAKFIIDTLDKTPQIYAAHVEGVCPDKECKPLMTYRVIPDKCESCGDCMDACLDDAVIGEKKKGRFIGFLPYEIVEVRCTRCNRCIEACRYAAIETADIGTKELAAV